MDDMSTNQESKYYKEFSFVKPAGFTHPSIKEIHDLMNNKKGSEENLFVIEGLWAYEKILQSGIKIKTFAFCPELINNDHIRDMVLALAHTAENPYLISNKLSSRLSNRDKSQGFFLVCSMPDYSLDDIKLGENNLFVVLDGLEKPGNIGTIIRMVDGAGGDAVIICNRKARPTHPEVMKSSMGSSFMVPVAESELTELAEWLKKNDFKIILADLTAKEYYFNADYKGRVAVVVGNEIHGISKAWYSYDCKKVIIPMLGGADSLNVGIAATLVTYEASLQQRGLIKRK